MKWKKGKLQQMAVDIRYVLWGKLSDAADRLWHWAGHRADDVLSAIERLRNWLAARQYYADPGRWHEETPF